MNSYNLKKGYQVIYESKYGTVQAVWESNILKARIRLGQRFLWEDKKTAEKIKKLVEQGIKYDYDNPPTVSIVPVQRRNSYE